MAVNIDDNRASIEVGERNTYVVAVTNAGPSSVNDAQSTVNLPAELDADTADRTCFAALGASCTGSGTGEVVDTVSLPAGSSLVYLLQADVVLGPTRTIQITATLDLPANVTAVDPGALSAVVATEMVITEDSIFRDRFEEGAQEATSGGAPRKAISGFLNLPESVHSLLPAQRLLSGKNAAGETLFEVVLAGSPERTATRLSLRGSDGQWRRSEWTLLDDEERWLAFEYDAEAGILLLAGESLRLLVILDRPGEYVTSIQAGEHIRLSVDD